MKKLKNFETYFGSKGFFCQKHESHSFVRYWLETPFISFTFRIYQ
jgi:hypothetical protein